MKFANEKQIRALQERKLLDIIGHEPKCKKSKQIITKLNLAR